MSKYPKVENPEMVGNYEPLANSGGGYVWDEVLEYRVWCHPHEGAPDIEAGNDYYYVFQTAEEAIEFSVNNKGTEEPLALILQKEYIDEPEPGVYRHMKEERIAEWPIKFLMRPQRNELTIPNFMAPDAPINKLDIIRGLA